MLAEARTTRQALTKPYMWLVIVAGALACIFSVYQLKISTLDLRFLGLAFVALFLSSRIVVQIPRFKSVISVSDTFLFLLLLLYGAETAVLVAATEALLSSLRFSNKRITVWFNFACCATSTFLTAHLLKLWFGDILALHRSELSAPFFL